MTARLLAFVCLVGGCSTPGSDFDAATVDIGAGDAASIDAGVDGGPCIMLCESCSLYPCEVHCTRDCAPAATAAGTCEAFIDCLMGPVP